MIDPRPTGRSGYRPEIDGLRAIAVLAVIAYHFNEHLLPSGFLGVDVFFVISGFVITASLAGHHESTLRSFLLGFYVRRVKRLMPLLIACVVLTTLIGFLVITPAADEYEATWKTGIAALFGAGNIVLQARQSDYFATDTALNPFTHTWSLGVEEQFYLLFPLLVFFSGFSRQRSGGARRLAMPLILLSVASLIGFAVLNGKDPLAVYYFFPARFWELAAGALAFLLWRIRRGSGGGVGSGLPLPAFLTAGLLVLLVLPRSGAPFTTPAVVLVTALLLLVLAAGQGTYGVLTTPAMRYLGLISYALYLWHWSVLSISAWTVGIHPWTVPLQLALILALAAASHHWIEQPLRRATWAGRPAVSLLSGLLAATAASVLLFLLGKPLRGALFTGTDAVAASRHWDRHVGITGTTVNGSHCHTGPEVQPGDFGPYSRRCSTVRRASDRQRLFLLGDSHALALMPLEQRLHDELPLQITHYSRSGCPFPPSASGHESSGCWAFSRQVLESVTASVRPGDIVVIHNYFRSHFGDGDDTRDMQIDAAGRHVVGAAAKLAYYRKALDDLAAGLAARGAHLVIFAEVPRFLDLRVDPNLCVRQWFRPWLPPQCQQPLRQPLARHRAENAAIERVFEAVAASHPQVHLFDPALSLCADGTCRSHDRQGNLLYRDRDHLNEAGVALLAADVSRFLAARGILAAPAPSAAPKTLDVH